MEIYEDKDLARLLEIVDLVKESLGLDVANTGTPLCKMVGCEIDPHTDLVDIFNRLGYNLEFMRLFANEEEITESGEENLRRIGRESGEKRFEELAGYSLNKFANQVSINDLYIIDKYSTKPL